MKSLAYENISGLIKNLKHKYRCEQFANIKQMQQFKNEIEGMLKDGRDRNKNECKDL